MVSILSIIGFNAFIGFGMIIYSLTRKPAQINLGGIIIVILNISTLLFINQFSL